ncbi:hypothetical protein PHMEG_00011798 [Phytophthora megakarya]|uniref:Reverse transcriptase n=1 Tax=Phytophthora megakarya TaxID=4795 RepID=A0A225WCX8_9STRA|nr:hypothetical protein PHMEG_00011798 [Phytophthora megakarya]
MNEVPNDLLFHSVLACIDDVLLLVPSARAYRENMTHDYARITAPLKEKLERVMQTRGRPKDQLSGTTIVWNGGEAEAFRQTLGMVERSYKLAFPDRGVTVCMFLDTSLTGYALVLT